MSSASTRGSAAVAPEAIPEHGRLACVVIEGQEIVLANVDDQVFALAGLCTHAECPLGEGDLEDHLLICPCHGGTFDVRTGEAVDGPVHEPLRRYPVSVLENGILIHLT
jgi:nitrite reductase/ring-hydroxylating ferredoxin subunit